MRSKSGPCTHFSVDDFRHWLENFALDIARNFAFSECPTEKAGVLQPGSSSAIPQESNRPHCLAASSMHCPLCLYENFSTWWPQPASTGNNWELRLRKHSIWKLKFSASFRGLSNLHVSAKPFLRSRS